MEENEVGNTDYLSTIKSLILKIFLYNVWGQ